MSGFGTNGLTLAGQSRSSSRARKATLIAGLLLVAAVLCLIGAAAQAAFAQAGVAATLSPGQSGFAQLVVRHVPPAASSGTGAYTARPAGKGCNLGRPLAGAPGGTTTPLRPTFTWSKVTGASYYDLEIYQGNTLKRHFDGHHGASRHVVKALPANVTLTWRVRARSARSAGAWSKGVKFVISPPGPESPDGTIVSAAPTFQWGKLSGATTYECSISGAGVRLEKSGLTTISYQFGEALPTNVPLTWKVRGSNADGEGVWSKDVAFSVVPDAPTLTITANDRNKTYGAALALGDSAFTSAGLRSGDSVKSVTLKSAGAAAAATVGGSPYAIVPSAAIGTGLGKYAITYVDGSLTVSKKALTITAKDRNKTYGATLVLGDSAFTAAGLLPGDSVKSVTLKSAGAAAAATVGGSPYAIAPSAASGTGLGVYAMTYVDGGLTVGRKALTISGAVAKDKFHDGTTKATVDFSGAGLSGVIGGNTVTLDSSACSARFDSASVGTHKPVTVTGVVLGGADAGNYAVSQPSGLSADIAPLSTAVSSSTATLQGRNYAASCFVPSGTATGDLVFAIVQARNSYIAPAPLAATVDSWTKIGDCSYASPAYGTPCYFYYALYYLKVGANAPWHDKWEFSTLIDTISVTNVTYRGASYDTASNTPYTTADTALRAGSVTPSAAGELLLFVGGAYDPSGIGTVSVSSAPAGFTTDVNVSSNDFLGYVARATDPLTSAALSGARTATLTTSTDFKHAWLIALKL